MNLLCTHLGRTYGLELYRYKVSPLPRAVNPLPVCTGLDNGYLWYVPTIYYLLYVIMQPVHPSIRLIIASWLPLPPPVSTCLLALLPLTHKNIYCASNIPE